MSASVIATGSVVRPIPGFEVDGKQVVNPLNQEVVTLRGIEPGEFTVNLNYYESKNGLPVEVTVSIIKVNPRAEVVFYGQLQLARQGGLRLLAGLDLAAGELPEPGQRRRGRAARGQEPRGRPRVVQQDAADDQRQGWAGVRAAHALSR